jgi:predicted O-methyltransferase YrrM
LISQAIQLVLRRIETEGLEHDRSESDHGRKWLNLEPVTAEAIAMILRIARVKDVLEIGTSTGYSTICIASVVSELSGRITTIERDERKHAIARDNVAEAGLISTVDLRLGEATDVVAGLPGPYDCVFFDADRISAATQLDLLLPKLSYPALVLADNAISHPDQIREYLNRINQLPAVAHTVLPIGKGLSVAHLS